jgi:hypothetical protein
VDDLFFTRMNGPDETTGEADEVICLAVDRFSQIKSHRFDQLTYGNNPSAKAVKLNYRRQSRAAHMENKTTSLTEFDDEAAAAAQTYDALVHEGSQLREEKRLSTSRKRQQTARERKEGTAKREAHESGSSAAASQAEARGVQLAREGKFLVDQVEDGVVAPGRTKRNALKVITQEQLLAIASQPVKRSKKAAKEAESSKPITDSVEFFFFYRANFVGVHYIKKLARFLLSRPHLHLKKLMSYVI